MTHVQREKNNILCVHQGSELYGSDKSFVAAVAALDKASDFDVEVVIPHPGPIQKLFAERGISAIETRHLWVLRKADLLYSLTLGLFANLRALWRALSDVSKYSLVYVNTAVIIDYLIASILLRRQIVVHVREIPTGFAMKVISALLRAANAKVIFNSNATRDAFNFPSKMEQGVVHNGFEAPAPFKKDLYDGARPLRILCIGRLNSWKGQSVLVRACARLTSEERERISVRIAGGVYKDQTHFRENLAAEIEKAGLGDTIEMVDFVDDPADEYLAADIVVVPSTLPEPFGRVAIEGMAYKSAVIASAHGGLTEIVEDGRTGTLIPPGDDAALAMAITGYLQDANKVREHGNEGAARFAREFTQEACDRALVNILRKWMDERAEEIQEVGASSL